MNHALALLLALSVVSIPVRAADREARIEEVLPSLERTARDYAKQFAAPGVAIAVVTPDEVRYLTFGVREEGKPAPINANTIFQLASVSKPITATLSAALVSQGKLRWDSKITDLLPGFTFADAATTRRLTVKDMLSQRSGLPGETGDYLETLGHDQRFILEKMRYVHIAKDFRQKWAYANFGITIGGNAAVAETTKPYARALYEELLRPLGMNSTFVGYKRLNQFHNRARLHFTIDGVSRPLFIRDADSEAPGGGVNGSVRDLARLIQLYLKEGRVGDKQLIDPAVLRQTYEPISDIGHDMFYGLCWNVNLDLRGQVSRVSHSGAFNAGSRTEIGFWPQDKIGIVVLTNNFPSLLPEAISEAFYQLYETGKVSVGTLPKFQRFSRQAFNIDADVERHEHSLDLVDSANGVPLAAYVGTYGNDYIGRVEVVLAPDPATKKPTLYLKTGGQFGPVKIQCLTTTGKLVSTTVEGDGLEYDFGSLKNGRFQTLNLPELAPIGWEQLKRIE